MKTELQQTGGHYDANYDNFHPDLYARVRRQAFGEDIGQNGWLGAREQDRVLPLLNLSQGRKRKEGSSPVHDMASLSE